MKKMLFAAAVCAMSFCGFATTHMVTDIAAHASAKDALRVKTGDIITLPHGTYGATGSGAETIDDEHFSGLGVLKVLRDDLLRPLTIIFR